MAKKKATTTKSKPPAHLIVRARAGTGKTTTMIEGIKALRGLPTQITPSTQQEAVWDQLRASKNAKQILFCAFNKDITEEMKTRLPVGQNCEAKTVHALGNSIIGATFGYKLRQSDYKTQEILANLLRVNSRDLYKNKPNLVKCCNDLVSFCKSSYLPHPTEEELDELAGHFDLELNGDRDQVFELVPKILDAGLDLKKYGKDFDDMIFAPLALNLPCPQYDLLIGDEAQDFNRARQLLLTKSAKRLVLVGDDRQAIYGFTGADNKSLETMQGMLENLGGCQVLPLTVTRRCGKAIVQAAQQYVPDFEAHESNGPGLIRASQFTTLDGSFPYQQLVKEGDLVLCRVNAPLVQQCFNFLKQGKRANIQGRDVGKGLIALVKKTKAQTIPELYLKLEDWAEKARMKENAKRNPSDTVLIAIQDKMDCLACFIDGAQTVEQVLRSIEYLFTDNRNSPGIRLSSIHKSKGLEADNVFFINTEKASCPHPMAKTSWARQQEENLLYVGITRAIQTLTWVQ